MIHKCARLRSVVGSVMVMVAVFVWHWNVLLIAGIVVALSGIVPLLWPKRRSGEEVGR